MLAETGIVRGFRLVVAIAGGSYQSVRHLLPTRRDRPAEPERVAVPDRIEAVPSAIELDLRVDVSGSTEKPYIECTDEQSAALTEYAVKEAAEDWAIQRGSNLAIITGAVHSDLDPYELRVLARDVEYEERQHRRRFAEFGCGAPSCDLCAALPKGCGTQ